jgi:hypothetical protein
LPNDIIEFEVSLHRECRSCSINSPSVPWSFTASEQHREHRNLARLYRPFDERLPLNYNVLAFDPDRIALDPDLDFERRASVLAVE